MLLLLLLFLLLLLLLYNIINTDPWKYIYIKKDLHPVYLKENKRIYKKLYDMKENPDNADKEIKVVKGKLLVDGNIIDKNTFLLRSR